MTREGKKGKQKQKDKGLTQQSGDNGKKGRKQKGVKGQEEKKEDLS